MRRISGKLNDHFAFLNANGAAPDSTKISCLETEMSDDCLHSVYMLAYTFLISVRF